MYVAPLCIEIPKTYIKQWYVILWLNLEASLQFYILCILCYDTNPEEELRNHQLRKYSQIHCRAISFKWNYVTPIHLNFLSMCIISNKLLNGL